MINEMLTLPSSDQRDDNVTVYIKPLMTFFKLLAKKWRVIWLIKLTLKFNPLLTPTWANNNIQVTTPTVIPKAHSLTLNKSLEPGFYTIDKLNLKVRLNSGGCELYGLPWTSFK